MVLIHIYFIAVIVNSWELPAIYQGYMKSKYASVRNISESCYPMPVSDPATN